MSDPSALQKEEERIKDELAKVTVKAWSDEEFRQLLMNDPRSALDSLGISWPDHIEPQFHVDEGRSRHFVIPLSPAVYFAQDVEYHLARLAKLHAEVTSTSSWAPIKHKIA